jgi:hypothetical protein
MREASPPIRPEEGPVMEQPSPRNARAQVFLDELRGRVSNPIHKRLVEACQSEDAVECMESELRQILLEILRRED